MRDIKIKSYMTGGYKAFAEPHQPIEIAPVTIVIGHNNAGKSALVRTPVLWADSLDSDSQLLNLNTRDLDFAQNYTDLFRSDHPTMEFVVDFEQNQRHFELKIELMLLSSRSRTYSSPKPVLRRLGIYEKTSELDHLPGLPLEVGLELTKDSSTTQYKSCISGNPVGSGSDWFGLLPLPAWLIAELVRRDGGSETLSLLMQLKKIGNAIHHLGPIRISPNRQYKNLNVAPSIGGRGNNTVELLAWDMQNGGTLLNDVSSWFKKERHFGFGLRLEGSSERAGVSSLFLDTDSGISVNLADAGSGVAQVLPLVVRRFQLESSDWRDDVPTLQIVEQPELHLHPAACGTLGDLIVDAALTGSADMLVETHSENLVLRVRRRIAEGKISADQVAIYWVENDDGTSASVRRLHIDPDGWIEDWPDGVFAEDAEEARALSRAMRVRQ